jgi:hypothetical protein
LVLISSAPARKEAGSAAAVAKAFLQWAALVEADLEALLAAAAVP